MKTKLTKDDVVLRATVEVANSTEVVPASYSIPGTHVTIQYQFSPIDEIGSWMILLGQSLVLGKDLNWESRVGGDSLKPETLKRTRYKSFIEAYTLYKKYENRAR